LLKGDECTAILRPKNCAPGSAINAGVDCYFANYQNKGVGWPLVTIAKYSLSNTDCHVIIYRKTVKALLNCPENY
jgi:hypothetical protein